VAVARVVGAHGLRGELVCSLLTDFPERFQRTREVLVGDLLEPRRVERHRLHADRVVLKLAGVDDRPAAEALRGALVQVPIEQAVDLPPGSYYWHEVVGLRVEDRQGRYLGTVSEVIPTGANDVYVVRSSDGSPAETLLPAIKDVILEIDRESGLMRVELIPGLVDSQ
jgi:16S rRNA processing protein RimM